MSLWVASTNPHKVLEIAQPLRELGVEVRGLAEIGAPPEVEETADTFAGNAVLKAVAAAAWLHERGGAGADLVLADDSGLCVEDLDGGPGVRSARFAGPGSGDEENNRRLVQELQARGLDSSPAEYACVLALCRVDGGGLPASEAGTPALGGAALCFDGRCRGIVRIERRGSGGFGYDPHFWIDDGARAFAELTPAQKAARSHRGAALRRLAAWLASAPR